MTTPAHASPGPGGQPADLTQLFQDSPATLLVIEADGVVSFASRPLRGADPVVGKSLLAGVAEKDHEPLRLAFEQALAGRSATVELEGADALGDVVWLEASLSPATQEGRRQVVLVAVDVTERRRTEEDLRRGQDILLDAQSVAHMGTWEWDVSQPHATWDAELYRIYGETPETYTPSYEAYLRKVHPDDRLRVMEVTERAMKEHVAYSHDERVFRPDGTMRHLHTWARPVLDERGRLVRLMGVCQDVTEQKLAESAMRTQTLTRGLARRLLVDLISRAHVPQSIVRDLGRGLAQSERLPTLQAHVDAFRDLGLGNLRFERSEGSRHVFLATDLLERRADSNLPTCFMTLGYLEGAVALQTGRRALGNEMRCQSMGHPECAFMIMDQG